MKHPIAEANEKSPFGNLTSTSFYNHHSITHSSAYTTNSRGLKLFTQWWSPTTHPPISLICIIHGYTGESSWSVQLTAVHLAKSGFIVCAIDHQGHGHSNGLDGLVAHIPDINPVVDDCVTFFEDFRERHACGLKAFLYAESLGGAIAILIVLRKRVGVEGGKGKGFDGLVMNGGMCGISDKFKPMWPLEYLLGFAATVLPTWQVVPTRGSIPDVSFKVEWKRKLAIASPKRYMGKPRAATAYELMRICREVQSRFEEFNIPLLIVHGGDDVVCDPQNLSARSSTSELQALTKPSKFILECGTNWLERMTKMLIVFLVMLLTGLRPELYLLLVVLMLRRVDQSWLGLRQSSIYRRG